MVGPYCVRGPGAPSSRYPASTPACQNTSTSARSRARKPTWSPRVTGCSRSVGPMSQSSHWTSSASAWLVSELGGYLCGRRLYETMLVWETDPSMRENELGAAFADVWCAIPKIVFSHTLDSPGHRTARRGVTGRGDRRGARRDRQGRRDRRRRLGRSGDRARPRRRAAHVPLSGRRRWRHAVPATRHRRHRPGPDRDQDVRLARDLRALRGARDESPTTRR